ncbi:hypothetical protein DdX_21167 [Ditylenchus destructor]|uniref:Uncharacterized protein n=1 Tax=Ditylenchus destructor TaxID=166010 RepID=A0AAD4QVS8_9BILA|nr:hypothetical protein DdX_21167 [Ditylenchus destructor]
MEGLVRPLKTRKFMTLSALNRIDGLGVRPKVDESGQVIQPVHESPIMVMDFVDDTAYHESMFEQNNIPVPQHHKPYASSLSSQYTLLYDLAIYAHDTIDGRPKVINPYDVVDLMEHKDTVSETGVQKVIDKNLSKVKDCRPIEIITLCSLRSKRQERHRGTTAAFLIFDNPVKGQAFWHIMQTELSSIGHEQPNLTADGGARSDDEPNLTLCTLRVDGRAEGAARQLV